MELELARLSVLVALSRSRFLRRSRKLEKPKQAIPHPMSNNPASVLPAALHALRNSTFFLLQFSP
jgi:hypothetical protein